MNRENALFAACGFLLGVIVGAFFLGELIHDARVDRRGAMSATEPRPPTSAADASTTDSANVMEIVREQIDRLNQLLRVNPNNAEALVQLGNLYMDAAKCSEAIPYYERALKLKNDPHAATDLGICYRAIGEPQRALRVFQDVYRDHPTHWQALFNEAVVLVDLEQYDKARVAIAQLRRERPTDPDIVKFQEELTRIGVTSR